MPRFACIVCVAHCVYMWHYTPKQLQGSQHQHSAVLWSLVQSCTYARRADSAPRRATVVTNGFTHTTTGWHGGLRPCLGRNTLNCHCRCSHRGSTADQRPPAAPGQSLAERQPALRACRTLRLTLSVVSIDAVWRRRWQCLPAPPVPPAALTTRHAGALQGPAPPGPGGHAELSNGELNLLLLLRSTQARAQDASA